MYNLPPRMRATQVDQRRFGVIYLENHALPFILFELYRCSEITRLLLEPGRTDAMRDSSIQRVYLDEVAWKWYRGGYLTRNGFDAFATSHLLSVAIFAELDLPRKGDPTWSGAFSYPLGRVEPLFAQDQEITLLLLGE